MPVRAGADRITTEDLSLALKALIRNERRSLRVHHSHLLRGHDVWQPGALRGLAERINNRVWAPEPALAASKLKGRFATRPLIIPHGSEELMVYAHLSRRLRDAVSDERRGWYGSVLYGNVPSPAGTPALLEPYLPHMLALNDHLSRVVRRRPVILSLDITGFYEHIQHEVLLDTVRREGLLGQLDTWLLERVLESFARRFGDGYILRQGLPQSYPTLSALFAEVYMIPLDARLRQLGIEYTRYVDDFRIMMSTPAQAEVRAFQVEAALRSLGLSFSSAKTELYDRTLHGRSEVPLMGGVASRRLPAKVTDWAGIFPHHEAYAGWQRDLREFWAEHAAPRDGQAFHRTGARFCLSRLEPDPDLVPDVVALLRSHPQEHEAACWFLSRVPRAELPWSDLRACLSEIHHGDAAASVLRALAPRPNTFPWPERPPEVHNWLRSLKRHPLHSVRLLAKEAEIAWRYPRRRPPPPAPPHADEWDVAWTLATHFMLPDVPRVGIRFPNVPAPVRRRRRTRSGRFTLISVSAAEITSLLMLAAYHEVSGHFRNALPLDGQGLHPGHAVRMVAHLDLLREQEYVSYAWAAVRLGSWLSPALPDEVKGRLQALLDGFITQRRERRFPSRQVYRDAIETLNSAVYDELRSALLMCCTTDVADGDGQARNMVSSGSSSVVR